MSGDESLSFVVNEQDYLAHYGRKGMKWYQHIFGDEETQYARKEKRINRKVARLNKKKAKQLKLSDRQLKDIYRMNHKLQKLNTGLRSIFYDVTNPNVVSLKQCLESAKKDREQTLLEVERLDSLITKQYSKLDKVKIKYGKAAVDEILDKKH